MSDYHSKSVKEIIELINNEVNGWFLPATQRPYVWGSRYESELYICKLFDSLLRGYPIGAMIVWQTGKAVAHRRFMTDYKVGQSAKLVDQGLWPRADKYLVYDGQQRLQTLYSCLRHTLNGKVLVFDLKYDLKAADKDPDETGFSFLEQNAEMPTAFLRMSELSVKRPDQETSFETEIMDRLAPLAKDEKEIVKYNLRQLWKVFVERDKKSIAYFPVADKDEDEVNEIFQRVNTGGIPLSQADLLLSRIKAKPKYADYEERLETISNGIFAATGKGYVFSQYDILQVAYLIHTGSSKIDPTRAGSAEDFDALYRIGEDIRKSLVIFFGDFLWGQFKINNAAIIPRKRALLPVLVYFHELAKRGVEFKRIGNKELMPLKQYLVLSQINDWNLQTLVDRFANIVQDAARRTTGHFPFPLVDFIRELTKSQKRPTDLAEARFVGYTWFSLKVLTPLRMYSFDPDPLGQRFKPEIDHIFPEKLEKQSEEYYRNVDVVWNLQPVSFEVNNYKRRKHPWDFFRGDGNKYLRQYDFVPGLDGEVWKRPLEFIGTRRVKMIEFLREQYELTLV